MPGSRWLIRGRLTREGMIHNWSFRLLLASGFAGLSLTVAALDTDYTLEIQGQKFTENPTDPNIFKDDFGVSFEAEFRTGFNDGNTIATFTPFGRWDSRDPQRRHGDIRELNLIHANGNWEYLAGIGIVFWGVTESTHLVDIINQTDALEGIDGEDKLGQPMIRASYLFDQSVFSVFVLPGFREREFLSSDNPLSLPFEIADDARYESSDEQDHVDYALRFSGYSGIVDYGLSWFAGTSRDPEFIPSNTRGTLIPFYPQIQQLGVDLQITDEAWLWKLEAIRRETDRNSNTAVVGGLEYSFYGMNEGQFDLGLLIEYLYDSRRDPAIVLFQNDLFLAMRFGFTDAESSEILAGAIFDQDDQSQSFRIEANRRVLTNAKISLEAQAFSNVDPNSVSFGFRNSDFIQLSLQLNF
jgi:hypothetical protein